MVTGKQTSEAEGKLPLDIANVDEHGVSRVDRRADAKKEATEGSEEAREQTKPKEGQKTSSEAPKTFTEEEIEKRIASVKGGYEGTLNKMRGDLKATQKRFDDMVQQQEEQSLAAYIKNVEDAGGDVDVARRTAEVQRQARTRERAIAQREAELQERETLLNEAGRTKAALDLVQSYQLGEKAVEELLKAEDLEKMENKALKMHIDALKGKTVPPENPDKAKGKTEGLDTSKMPLTTRLGMAWEGKI